MNYIPPTPENPEPDWKKCKILGSLLDTPRDVDRRKGLTLGSMNEFDHVYKSKRIGTDLKVRNFNIYSTGIFLYNSELWTLTETQMHAIDSFHKRLLRRVINIRWPKIISNEKLYQKVSVAKWSDIIMKRRLYWLGHLMRLEEKTPVRQSLRETLTDAKEKIGRPCLTWMKVIEKDLAMVNVNLDLNKSTPDIILEKLVNLTKDRENWRKIVRDIMAVNC